MGLLASLLRGGFARARPAAAATGDGAAADILAWVAQGLPAPPPHAVKQAVVRALAARHGLRVLVETGTFMGDMVAAMREDFARIVSIELSPQLHARAAARFAGDPRIALIEGDSGGALAGVLATLAEPALFWLDGHYSAGQTARGATDTPVREELAAIFAARELPHVVLIDDARLFGRDPAYPSLDALRALLRERRPAYTLEVEADIIRLLPPAA